MVQRHCKINLKNSLSFFCKFVKFAHTIQWRFLQKFLFGHFYVFRELFCLLQHILATVQPKIHLNTKLEILPFGWTKCPKTEPFFKKLPICPFGDDRPGV